MKRSSAGYNGFGTGSDAGGPRPSGASSAGSGRSGGSTLGKIRKSLTRRLSVSSRRSSNSSIETPRGSGRVDHEFPSLTGSEHDPHPRTAEQVSRVEVIFPIPAPPAPRGAPHGEPLTPLPPADGRGSSGASEAGTAQADADATAQVSPVRQLQTSIAAPAALPTGNDNGNKNTATPEAIAAGSATSGTKTAASGATTVTSAGYLARDALRAERIADDEAAVAARAQAEAEAAARAASSALAAQEAASRASLAVAAAVAASSGSVSSTGIDESTGLPYVDEDDSGFGPLPDLDFADRVWTARPQGQTRILSRVEMSVMSSSSSQSSRRDRFDGVGSERSTPTVGTRRSGGKGGDGTREEGAGGAMRDIEEKKQLSSTVAEGMEVGDKDISDGVTGRRSSTSSNGSGSSRSRRHRSTKTYNRRHSDGEDRVGDSQDLAASSGSLEEPSVLKSQSQSILATPSRARSSLTVAPRSAGRRNTQRPRSKKPRDSVGLMVSGSGLRPSEEGQRQFEPPGPPRRRWQKWLGNNKFFCNGRVMLGVHYRQLITTTLLLSASWIVFFVFILPEYGEWLYVVVAVSLCIGSFVALVYSSFLDPGIIPRRAATGLPDSIPPDVRDQLNYCITCHIVRPPRTKHCKHCNNCVLAFDHHCPWTGNCVGARNYRAFMAFIILVTLSSSFVCTLSVLHVLTRTVHIGPAELTDAAQIPGSRFVSPALSLWTALVTLLVGALLGFHAYLLSKGQTTNEYLRGEKRRGNVPHRSFFPNCGQLWCGKQPPSMLPDMTEFPSDREADLDMNYAVNAYTELQDVIRPRGDMV